MDARDGDFVLVLFPGENRWGEATPVTHVNQPHDATKQKSHTFRQFIIKRHAIGSPEHSFGEAAIGLVREPSVHKIPKGVVVRPASENFFVLVHPFHEE